MKENKKAKQVRQIQEEYDLYRFNGALFAKRKGSTSYERLEYPDFQRLCYDTLGVGTSESEIKNLAGYFYSSAKDITRTHSHLIEMADWRVWDMSKLRFVESEISPVYRARVSPNEDPEALERVDQFILDLANGDPSVQQDIYQSLAPFFMYQKPPGVIWFYGNGQNGKSSLIEAMTRIIGDHLASISLEGIESGRNAPVLNGSLGNLVRESSEAYVENSANYKSLGTHEPFTVDRMYSQTPVRIGGNIHTVFNANNLPTFADKSVGITRRTFTVPFTNTFPVDLDFEDRTFTPAFLGALLHRLLEYTHFIRNNGKRYVWSDASIRLKQTYDDDQDSTRAYLKYLRDEHPELVGFRSYGRLNNEYVSWCIRTGSTRMSEKSLKKTFRDLGGIEERKIRQDGVPVRYYVFGDASTTERDKLETVDGLLVRPSLRALAEKTELSEEW